MKGIRYLLLLVVGWCFIPAEGLAQNDEYSLIHKGNRLFNEKQYAKAALFYRRALNINPRSARALYNLGNTQLAQKKPKEAMKLYEQAVGSEKNRNVAAMAYHNMGVILQGQKQYADAIACYKNALRRNPNQDDSRYNLSLCQRLLKKQPQQQSDKNQDKQGQPQQQQQQSKSKPDSKQKQNDQSQMSRQNAESLLKNVVEREERNTQEKLKKAQRTPQTKRLEKNW